MTLDTACCPRLLLPGLGGLEEEIRTLLGLLRRRVTLQTFPRLTVRALLRRRVVVVDKMTFMAEWPGRILAGPGQYLIAVDDLPHEPMDRKFRAFSGLLASNRMAAFAVGREQGRLFLRDFVLIEVTDKTLRMDGPALLDSGGESYLCDNEIRLIHRVTRNALEIILLLERTLVFKLLLEKV